MVAKTKTLVEQVPKADLESLLALICLETGEQNPVAAVKLVSGHKFHIVNSQLTNTGYAKEKSFFEFIHGADRISSDSVSIKPRKYKNGFAAVAFSEDVKDLFVGVPPSKNILVFQSANTTQEAPLAKVLSKVSDLSGFWSVEEAEKLLAYLISQNSAVQNKDGSQDVHVVDELEDTLVHKLPIKNIIPVKDKDDNTFVLAVLFRGITIKGWEVLFMRDHSSVLEKDSRVFLKCRE